MISQGRIKDLRLQGAEYAACLERDVEHMNAPRDLSRANVRMITHPYYTLLCPKEAKAAYSQGCRAALKLMGWEETGPLVMVDCIADEGNFDQSPDGV
jgi:hypothetical protein